MGARERVKGYPWWLEPASLLGAAFLRLLGATWRIDRSSLAAFDERMARGQSCVLAFWHARLLPLVYFHRDRGIAVLVSRHRDGQLIARILERLGCVLARGSSTRGGEEAARELLDHAREGRVLAMTPDGPRGPAEQLKPGVIAIASWSGLPVVPLASASSSAWVFRSWDRFRVPKPFARVAVEHGEPVPVPKDLERADVEAWRAEIERLLIEHTERVRRGAGERA